MDPARFHQLKDLRRQLEQLEQTLQPEQRRTVSTGIPALDRLFPGHALSTRTLIELVSSSEGCGAMTLALVLAARMQSQGGALVVIDEQQEFFPPAASAAGVSLARTLVVQPRRGSDALWAWEQSLRSPAVSVVIGWLDKIDDRTFRRLQLAAERGDSLGCVMRPWSCKTEPSWAAVRLAVEGVPCNNGLSLPRRNLRVEVLYRRGGLDGKAIVVELSHEANPVHLVSTLADPAPPRRLSGA
jgi:protein ImuA